MFLTLKFLMDDEEHFITFEGSPKECQDYANGFLGDGLYVKRIIVMGEK